MNRHLVDFVICYLYLFILLPAAFMGSPAWSCDLRVIVPDVGMGQAVILLESGRAILIDTGPVEQTKHLQERMSAHGVHSLDYLFLTHFHPDHAGGYVGIRRLWPHTPVLTSDHFPKNLIPVDRIFVPGVMEALANDPLHRIVHAGDTIYWQGNQLHIIWPKSPSGNNLNKMSLVLLVRTACGRNILIMGDVDRDVEHGLIPVLKQFLENTTVDILIAGHHGASDSTDPELIRITRPQIGIVSVGLNNSLAYPAKNVMTRLRKFCGKVLRTDRDGELCFRLSATGPAVCAASFDDRKPMLSD